MAIYYIDPEGGDNANDGTSFAQRRRTPSGLTLATNDEIRYIASPDPYSVGTGAWVDNSEVITFSSLPVLPLDEAGVNWTASANVTAALSTANRVHGANAQSITPVSAFTTGKLAYRTLPATLDLSAYDTISLQARFGTTTTAAGLQLVLCSDSTGDVPVETISFASAQTTGPTGGAVNGAAEFNGLVYRKGAALPTNVNSLALYAVTDPGTAAIVLDNIIATTELGGMTHKDLIGKNTAGEPYWYPIVGLTSTTVSVGVPGALVSDRPNGNPPYRGVSESAPTFIQPVMQAMMGSVDRTIPNLRYSRISGGWDRTTMGTQSGQTYICPALGSSAATGSGFLISNSGLAAEFDHFSIVAFANSGFSGTVEVAHDVDFIGVRTNNRLGVPAANAAGSNWAIRYDVMNARFIVPAGAPHGLPNLSIDAVHNPATSGANTGAVAFTGYTGFSSAERGRKQVRIGKVSYAPRFAIQGADVDVVGCTFSDNFGDVIMGDVGGSLGLIGCTPNPSVTIVSGTSLTAGTSAEVWNKDTIWRKGVTIANQSVTPPPVGAKALQAVISLSSYYSSANPGRVLLGRIAAPAGTLSISAALQRNTGAGSYAAIQVRAYSAPGITVDQTSASPTATGAWETKTISVTTTDEAVIEVYGVFGGDSGAEAYFGDLTWT